MLVQVAIRVLWSRGREKLDMVWSRGREKVAYY
jgi:hypothetical protein